jgi:hypothetical protein
VLGAYLVLGICGRWAPGGGTTRPRMRLAGGVAFAGAAAAYVVLPHHLHAFELMTFSPRFAVLLVAMALLLVPGALRDFGGYVRPLLLLPALLMCGLHGQDLIRVYRQYDAEVADFAAVVAKVPPGGKALGMVYDRTSRVMKVESALIGLPALYPVLRRAPGSMTTLAYCGMRHMPCRRKEAGKLPDPGPWLERNMDMDVLVPFYDYFFVRLPPRRPIFGKQSNNVELLAQSGSWLVYKRKSPAAAPITAGPAAPTAVRLP